MTENITEWIAIIISVVSLICSGWAIWQTYKIKTNETEINLSSNITEIDIILKNIASMLDDCALQWKFHFASRGLVQSSMEKNKRDEVSSFRASTAALNKEFQEILDENGMRLNKKSIKLSSLLIKVRDMEKKIDASIADAKRRIQR